MGRVRGASIVGTFRYVRERFGDDAHRRTLDALPASVRNVVGEDGAALVEIGWYDHAVLAELTRTVDRLCGSGDLALAREMGRAQAFHDTSRFFKWMLRLTGPKPLFTRAPSVWSNYHDAGRFVLEELSDHRAVVRIEEWSSAGDAMCRRVEGWIERALEITLGDAVKPSIREIHHLDYDPAACPHAFCRFVAEWR